MKAGRETPVFCECKKKALTSFNLFRSGKHFVREQPCAFHLLTEQKELVGVSALGATYRQHWDCLYTLSHLITCYFTQHIDHGPSLQVICSFLITCFTLLANGKTIILILPVLFSSPVGSLCHAPGVVHRPSCVVCVHHTLSDIIKLSNPYLVQMFIMFLDCSS